MTINQSSPFSGKWSTETSSRIGEEQTATILDLISEGEIEGLVNGEASILLDGTPIISSSNQTSEGPRMGVGDSTATSATLNNITLGDGMTSASNRYIRVKKAGKTFTSDVNTTKGDGTVTLSVGTTAFAAADANFAAGYAAAYLYIPGAGRGGQEYVGRITKFTSTTSVEVYPFPETTVSNATGALDLVSTVSSVTSTTVVMNDVAISTVSDTEVYIGPKAFDYTDPESSPYNFEKIRTGFKTGTIDQDWLNTGVEGNTSFAQTFGTEIQASRNPSGTDTIAAFKADAGTVKTSSDIGVATAAEIDSLKITMLFPAMVRARKTSGSEYPSRAEFQIFFEYQRDSIWYNSDGTAFSSLPPDSLTPVFGVSANTIDARTGTDEQKLNKFDNSAPPRGEDLSGWVHKQSKKKFIKEFAFNIEAFKPFTDFRIRIRRVTNDEYEDESGDNDLVNQHRSFLQAIFANIHDKLSYPLTAYGMVQIPSQEFETVPKRQYDVKGLKIQVPTNYFPETRTYTRNVSTGADAGTYQTWDGKFRGDQSDSSWVSNPDHVNFPKVYSNNPAWIFYDIIVNNRYGLGDFIDPIYVDKYELYQIAQYCDELVPDGNGGTEPRFTCNIYIQSAQDAYTILKDLASIFRGIVYWKNGLATIVQDRPKEPVYTFTKGNIIGGDFSYQTSASRLRTNQVNVTWINPAKSYKQDVEVVEDSEDIINNNRIISKDIVAMGCTSQGQANRLGKWMVLTERLESSLISFATSMNASTLQVGDVILVQDADKTGVAHSGRISSGKLTFASSDVDPATNNITITGHGFTVADAVTYSEGLGTAPSPLVDSTTYYIIVIDANTIQLAASSGDAGTGTEITLTDAGKGYNHSVTQAPTTAIIPLDRVVTLEAADYRLHLVYPTGGGYLEEDSATISTVAYVRGDYLPTITSQSGAANAVDDSGNHIKVHWSEDTHTEFYDFTASAANYRFITGASFSGVPNAEVIWALSNLESENLALQSTEYRVLSVSEEENQFTITGMEYLDSKFDAVDRGYELYQKTFSTIPNYSEIVPKPRSLSLRFNNVSASDTYSGQGSPINQALVSWEPPMNSDDLEIYDHLSSYEIKHNFGNDVEIIRISASVNSLTFPLAIPKLYRVAVRTVNSQGQYSQWVAVEEVFANAERYDSTINSTVTEGVKHGGNIDAVLSLNKSTGLVSFNTTSYTITAPNGTVYNSPATDPPDYDFSSLSGTGNSAYLMWDASATDWKIMEILTDTTVENPLAVALNINYWGELGGTALSTVTGTADATVTETVLSTSLPNYVDSATITGASGLSSDFSAGSMIKFEESPNTGSFWGFVKEVVSDTKITTTRPINVALTSAVIKKLTLQPDYQADFIAAKITDNGAGVFSIERYANTRGTDAKVLRLTSDGLIFEYDGSGTYSPTYIEFTANIQNLVGNITWTATGDITGAVTLYSDTGRTTPSTVTDETVYLHDDDFTGNNYVTISVSMDDNTFSPAVTYTDQATVQQVINDDSVHISLDNQSAAVACNSGGTAKTSPHPNTGVVIEAWLGSTQLATDNSVPYATPSFRVGTPVVSNITAGAPTYNANDVTFANATGISSVDAYIEFPVTVVMPDSSEVTYTVKQTINKVLDGATGSTGAIGLKTGEGYVYYQLTGDPGANPTATSYTFSTYSFSGLSANWGTSPPTYVGSNSNTYYYSKWGAIENSSGAGVASGGNLVFGTRTQGIGFTGLVTFSSADAVSDGTNSLSFGSSGTTQIDGGVITTGQIKSTGYTYSSGNFSTTGTEFDVTSGRIRSVNWGIDSSGNAYMKNLTLSGNLAFTTGGVIKNGATAYNSGTGFWLEYNAGTPRLFIGNSAGSKVTWDGSTLTVTGTVNINGAGSMTGSGGIVMSSAGYLKTSGKDSLGDVTAGIFIGHDGVSNYDLDIGDSSKYLRWDGSAGTLQIGGDIVATGNIQAAAVTNAKLGNEAVENGKVKQDHVTVRAVSIGSSSTGTGWNTAISSLSVTTQQASTIIILWSFQQGYSAGTSTWGVRITRLTTGDVLNRSGMTALTDFPSGINRYVQSASGTSTFSMDWNTSDHTDLTMSNPTMILLVLQR